MALALALLIGLSLGLLGGGGSILTVPVLVYALGFAPKPAIAMSLPVVGVTSLAGAALHWRLGNVRLRPALVFGALAMGGAFVGARLSVHVADAVQLSLLALVMLAAGVSLLRRRQERSDGAAQPASPRFAALVPAALAVGILTGLVGIGGGFLVVPALVLLAHVPMRQAVGTSLLVIALNSAAGFAGYLGTVQVDWDFLARFTTIAAVGSLVGAGATRLVSPSALRSAFGAFLLAGGAFVLYMNRSALGITGDTGATSSRSSPTTR